MGGVTGDERIEYLALLRHHSMECHLESQGSTLLGRVNPCGDSPRLVEAEVVKAYSGEGVRRGAAVWVRAEWRKRKKKATIVR